MSAWIVENMATILVSAILAAAVAGVIVSMVRNKRKGKSSCGCGCAGCSMNGSCHSGK
ncbi:MAG: FeoB-associated Cys-rich membrane protein [Lachnospiraceae bacterium]|nr:FeoB-associated Cys-rich membrane protein [Lachnospiraceae bacterium]